MEDHQSDGQGQVGISTETQSHSVVPGGALTIPLSLHNQGESEELLELSVRGIPSAWVSLPSPLVRLEPGQQREVALTIQTPGPPWGRAACHSVAIWAGRQRTPEPLAELEFTLTIAEVEVPGRIGILLESAEFSAVPGESTFVPVVLVNRGVEGDSLNLSVQGIPADWASVPSSSVRLDPGQQREVRLTIRPPRATSSPAGTQTLKILASSQFLPGQVTEVACTLSISAFSEVSCDLQPRRIEAGQPARVSVTNQGNFKQTFSLTWASPDDRLTFLPAPAQEVSVLPGHVGAVEFQVEPRRRALFGGEVTLPFAAYVECAQEAVETLTGAVTSRALAPKWVPAGLVVSALVLVAAWFVLGG